MATERPSGTVTFLFTDIEGSTGLWEKHPAAMATTLERHDAIVRDAIVEHGGHVFATGGDGFGVAFERAEVAVRTAIELQRRLVTETWPAECPIAVRMGVHSGETTERAGDYFGSTVNRCARIMSIAHAGQILVSELTRNVVIESGLGAVGFEPRGAVVLRGTDDPVTLYRAVADGIPVIDEPLLQAAREGNVVPPPTSFVGRENEVADLLRALDEQHLVTLIGVGGVGKTRLATEAALEASGHDDGVWMVELGPINTADQVADALSDAIGLRPTPGVSAERSVVEWCSSRDLLLVLDNCEHVLRGAADLVSSLLTAAPAVTVLATSREPLMVRGEHVVPVPSLSLESSDGGMSEAVGFFSERARAELPGYDPDAHTDAVLEICTRLDGIPLALELAAARVRGLSVPDIARRLDERFRLLTGGRIGSVERHATLRAAVAWSHDLLDAAERDLFERLSVFAGRFNVDDAIGLCGEGADEFEVIDTLSGLIDRSLVVREEQQPEYRMLETLRAFGREQLTLGGRVDDIRGDHATLMAAKAKESRRAAAGPSELAVVALLDAQMADYGVAADWAIGAGRPELAVAMAEDCLFTQWSTDEPGTWVTPLVDSERAESRIPRALALTAHHALYYRDAIPLAIELAEAAIAADPTISLAHQQMCVAGMMSGRTDIVRHGRNALDTAVDDNERAGALLVLSHALLVAG